jgi:hypothetical protein
MKIQFRLLLSFLILVSMLGTLFTNFSMASSQEEPPYHTYFPLILKNVIPDPPAYYSTTWYVTPYSVNNMYQYGLKAAAITQPSGRQDQLLILDFGQPWSDGIQYGTLLLKEPQYNLASTNDIKIYTKNFINGFIVGSDGESKLELGIGTTNYAYYISGVCSQRSWFCTTERAYNHGKAWVLMVKDLNNWVIQQGYANRVSIAGASDIELAWNYATITHAWAKGFDDFDEGKYIYYNFGACEGCDIGINLSIPPNPEKDLVYDWTPRKAHYTAWGIPPAWPIPEIYLNNGWHANQWANLSKVGVDIGYNRMYFFSALTQYQACLGSADPTCPATDNTPEEGWIQLINALSSRPETAQSYIPYMTDIDWP